MRQLEARMPGRLAAPQLAPVRFIENELVMLKTWAGGGNDQPATVRMVTLEDGAAFCLPNQPVEARLVGQSRAGRGNRGSGIGGDGDLRGIARLDRCLAR